MTTKASSFKQFVAIDSKSSSIAGDGSFLKEMLNGVLPGVGTANTLSSLRQNQGRLMSYKRYEEDPKEEEQEQSASKIDQARNIFASMHRNPNTDRQTIIDAMMKYAQVTHSTAVSYYERLAKEAGITNQGAEEEREENPMTAGDTDPQYAGGDVEQQDPNQMTPGMEEMPDGEQGPEQQPEVQHTFPDNPNKQGVIRHVDKAHLVYKRQTPDGTFEELWTYNISTDMKDELSIRRKILAGTDIPSQKTKSPDGSQSYTLTTLGNGQMLNIMGLPQ